MQRDTALPVLGLQAAAVLQSLAPGPWHTRALHPAANSHGFPYTLFTLVGENNSLGTTLLGLDSGR